MPLSVRLADVLPPGVAAELATWLPQLPLGIETEPEGRGLWWGCEVGVPPTADPQTPPCVYALVRFLDDDVPALIPGRTLVPAKPRTFHLRVWRKGSFVDDGPIGAPGTVHAILGLTGARWPAAWGGGLALAGEVRPPGWDTLDLVDGETSRRVALVTHHVSVLTVVATYGEPA